MRQFKFWFILFIIGQFTVSVSYARSSAAGHNGILPIYVSAMKAQAVDFSSSIEASGTFKAEQGIIVKAETAGRVVKIFFTSGQYVKQGQPLVQLYPDVLQATLNLDQAKVQLNKMNFARMQKLIKQGAVSQADYDTAQANYAEALAELKQTQAQLAQTLITAPFSGYVGIRQVNLGDYLNTGDAIVSLEDTDPLYIDFTIPEKDAAKIQPGDKVVVRSNVFPKQEFIGAVTAKDVAIDAATRMLNVRAQIPNPQHQLIPGGFGIVHVYYAAPNQVVKVPQAAIVYGASGTFVFRVQDNKVKEVSVELGERDDNDVYILNGIKPDDLIVVDGTQKLVDGERVTIANR